LALHLAGWLLPATVRASSDDANRDHCPVRSRSRSSAPIPRPLPLPRRSLMTAGPTTSRHPPRPARPAAAGAMSVGSVVAVAGLFLVLLITAAPSPIATTIETSPGETAPYRVRRTASASCCHRSTAETSRSWSSGRWGTSALIPRMRSARRAVRTFPKPAIWSPWRRSIWLPVRTVPPRSPRTTVRCTRRWLVSAFAIALANALGAGSDGLQYPDSVGDGAPGDVGLEHD
jgi:hypothetical protein